MVNPKISVLLSFFNCEKYIHQCIISLMEQSYENIEYIFIDDASTDNSLVILKDTVSNYPARQDQVRIIELPENKGLANARRVAIKETTGDYIIFCDGDDWVEKNAYSVLCDEVLRTGVDIVCTPYFLNTNKSETAIFFNKLQLGSLNEIPLDAKHFSLCNKLIKYDLVIQNEIAPFENVNCWDDLSVTARLFALTDKIVILDTPFYHYRKQTNTTLTTSNQKRILKDHLLCAEKLVEWFEEKGKTAEYRQFLTFLKFTAKIKMLRGKDKDVARWKETFPETNAHISSFKNIPFHYRVLFHLANTLPTKFTQSIANAVGRFCN